MTSSLPSVKIGPWTVAADTAATEAAYAQITTRSPEQCSCLECANFLAVGEEPYPSVALGLFGRLGIQPVREAELAGIFHPTERVCEYLGWVHFFGDVLGGPAFPTVLSQGPREQVARLDYVDLAPGFGVGVRRSTSLAFPPFLERPEAVVQLDFCLRLPWVLDTTPEG